MHKKAKKLKVLFASSEVYPFAKSGGLADVAYALPKALSKKFEINVILPLYASIDIDKYYIKPVRPSFSVEMGGKSYDILLHKCRHEGIIYIFVQSERISEKEYFYGPPDQGYADNAVRFALFCRAIIEVLKEDSSYTILHCNDWQTALAPLLVKEDLSLHIKTVFTIHNLAYQGIFDRDTLDEIGLSPGYFHSEALEYYGAINLMKAGIVYADSITTVSSEYAKEIQTQVFGCGLEGLLVYHRTKLHGILNGIDTEFFDPQSDPLISHHYTPSDLDGKKSDKKAFLKYSGLKGAQKPLFVFIGRFTEQKGISLLIEILEQTASLEINIAILGEGEIRYRTQLEQIVSLNSHIHLFFGYDEETSHRLYAAGDFLLMPSFFEPCGLTQMIAMRYGTVPIVHNVGGLKQTVHSYKIFDPGAKHGFGITYSEQKPEVLLDALLKAVKLYKTPFLETLNLHNMRCDFSWTKSVEAYTALYHNLEQL